MPHVRRHVEKGEIEMKVYALQTHEPIETRMMDSGFDTGGEMPDLYLTRKAAEAAAKIYNDSFNDDEPATVVEIEVREDSAPRVDV
jgi:hypothetical protein